LLSGLTNLKRTRPLLESSRVLLLFLILGDASFGVLGFDLGGTAASQMILLLDRDHGLIVRLVVIAEVPLRANVIKLEQVGELSLCPSSCGGF